MIRYTIAVALMLGTLVASGIGQRPTLTAEKVGVCTLQADPAAYDHKLLEVSGLVSHEFEHFMLSDSRCAGRLTIWLEYGGTVNSDTVHCCGVIAGRPRRGTLVVEGITVPMVEDDVFERFDARVRGDGSVVFRATIIGRFFAGRKQQLPGGEFWGGYGHLGCCSLMVIQQVLAVDSGNGQGAGFGPSGQQSSDLRRQTLRN